MGEFVQVSTTTSSREAAGKLAQELVARRLAACVQVLGPITSMYWWQDAVQTDEEWLCVAKTRRDVYPQVEATIRDLHSYEVPEILAVEIVEGSASYLDWLDKQVRVG